LIFLSDATRQQLHCLFYGQAGDAVEKYLPETCGDDLPGVAADYLQLAAALQPGQLIIAPGTSRALS